MKQKYIYSSTHLVIFNKKYYFKYIFPKHDATFYAQIIKNILFKI